MEFLRQRDLLDGNKIASFKFMLIGVGGIGSFVGRTLCKMGVQKLQMWDKDNIEMHNIPNQNYGESQCGQPKVEALRKNIHFDTGVIPEIVNDFWEGDFRYNPDIMIWAVDSMDIRFRLWEHITKSAPKGMWLLDPRMSSRAMNMFCCRVGNEESMANFVKHGLYPSSEADKEPCTARAIIHTCEACAYMVGNAVHDIVKNGRVMSCYFGDLLNFSLTKSSIVVE